MTGIEILGIVGSLRAGSLNHLALKAAQELVPDGAVLDLIELHGIPVFNQDDEVAIPAAVREFKRRIMAANAILFATPEYNYSLPGALKNAIDWASRPLRRECLAGQAGGDSGGFSRPTRNGARAIPSSASPRCSEHACRQSTGGDDWQRRAAV